MIAMWMLYSIGVGVVLLLCGVAAEYVVRALGWPTRLVWAATILASTTLSALALVRHRVTVAPAPPRVIYQQVMTSAMVATPTAVVAPPSPTDLLSTLHQRWQLIEKFAEGVAAAPEHWHVWDHPLVAGWYALSALIFAIWLVGFLRLRGARRQLVPQMVDDTQVWVSKDLGPAILGILRYRIVMPAWAMALPAAERRTIIAHEEEHARAIDPALLWGAAILLTLQPWNLGLWQMLARLRFATEADCDARVLARAADPRFYSRLLLTVYERSTPGLVPLVAFLKPTSHLERRIRRMLARKPSLTSLHGTLATLVATALGVLAFAAPVPAVARAQVVVAAPPDQPATEPTVVTADSSTVAVTAAAPVIDADSTAASSGTVSVMTLDPTTTVTTTPTAQPTVVYRALRLGVAAGGAQDSTSKTTVTGTIIIETRVGDSVVRQRYRLVPEGSSTSGTISGTYFLAPGSPNVTMAIPSTPAQPRAFFAPIAPPAVGTVTPAPAPATAAPRLLFMAPAAPGTPAPAAAAPQVLFMAPATPGTPAPEGQLRIMIAPPAGASVTAPEVGALIAPAPASPPEVSVGGAQPLTLVPEAGSAAPQGDSVVTSFRVMVAGDSSNVVGLAAPGDVRSGQALGIVVAPAPAAGTKVTADSVRVMIRTLPRHAVVVAPQSAAPHVLQLPAPAQAQPQVIIIAPPPPPPAPAGALPAAPSTPATPAPAPAEPAPPSGN